MTRENQEGPSYRVYSVEEDANNGPLSVKLVYLFLSFNNKFLSSVTCKIYTAR